MLRRHLAVAHRLGGAAAPVFGAGDRQRRLGGDRSQREAVRRLADVAEKAERDPAGVELAIDFACRIVRPRRVGAKGEGELRLVDVEQLTRHHAPLAPPAVRIDERGPVGRREGEQRRRLVGATRAPRILDAGEQQPRVALERIGDGLDQRRRQRPAGGG